MKIAEVKKLTHKERLLYWIEEREKIRLAKKFEEHKPWTDDEILQQYRFCNVRRMDDKVSQWLLENWYKPYFGHPNILVACALARHFNQPAALANITDWVFRNKQTPHFEVIKKVMRVRKNDGLTIFNGAYMVRGIGTADKTEMVVDMVCKPLHRKPPKIDTSSMQRSVEALLPYWGFSTFMAGQVVADLRWAEAGSWRDKDVWAPIGPGSKRGMNRLHNRHINETITEEQWIEELKGLIWDIHSNLPAAISDRMEAIDAQNCLCEYDKYTRTLLGEGKPKQKYPGGAT